MELNFEKNVRTTAAHLSLLVIIKKSVYLSRWCFLTHVFDSTRQPTVFLIVTFLLFDEVHRFDIGQPLPALQNQPAPWVIVFSRYNHSKTSFMDYKISIIANEVFTNYTIILVFNSMLVFNSTDDVQFFFCTLIWSSVICMYPWKPTAALLFLFIVSLFFKIPLPFFKLKGSLVKEHVIGLLRKIMERRIWSLLIF